MSTELFLSPILTPLLGHNCICTITFFLNMLPQRHCYHNCLAWPWAAVDFSWSCLRLASLDTGEASGSFSENSLLLKKINKKKFCRYNFAPFLPKQFSFLVTLQEDHIELAELNIAWPEMRAARPTISIPSGYGTSQLVGSYHLTDSICCRS